MYFGDVQLSSLFLTDEIKTMCFKNNTGKLYPHCPNWFSSCYDYLYIFRFCFYLKQFPLVFYRITWRKEWNEMKKEKRRKNDETFGSPKDLSLQNVIVWNFFRWNMLSWQFLRWSFFSYYLLIQIQFFIRSGSGTWIHWLHSLLRGKNLSKKKVFGVWH